MNTGGKGSLREGRIAQMTASPALHWVIPVHLKHGGTQLQTWTEQRRIRSISCVVVDGFARIEKRGVGEEFVGFYLYQVHLYRCLESNDYGRLLSGNNAHITVGLPVCPSYRSTSKLNGIFAQHSLDGAPRADGDPSSESNQDGREEKRRSSSVHGCLAFYSG